MPLPPQKPPLPFGSFQLLGRLAKGGMGEVFLALRPMGEGRRGVCVLKKMLFLGAEGSHLGEMFLDEARNQALLEHPNIASIFETGEVGVFAYIAMEFVHGVSLADVVWKAKKENNPIHPAHAARLLEHACAGLSHAHHGVDEQGEWLRLVHRDINPHNLLVSYPGKLKIIDFGVAKSRANLALTEEGTIKGKVVYMAPEQALAQPLDLRADIFALGLCLYELLTGKNPFERTNIIATVDALQYDDPPALESLRPDAAALGPLVERALSKNREDRFSDALEMERALATLRTDGLLGKPPQSLETYILTLFADRKRKFEDLVRQSGVDPGMLSARAQKEGSLPDDRTEMLNREKTENFLWPLSKTDEQGTLSEEDVPSFNPMEVEREEVPLAVEATRKKVVIPPPALPPDAPVLDHAGVSPAKAPPPPAPEAKPATGQPVAVAAVPRTDAPLSEAPEPYLMKMKARDREAAPSGGGFVFTLFVAAVGAGLLAAFAMPKAQLAALSEKIAAVWGPAENGNAPEGKPDAKGPASEAGDPEKKAVPADAGIPPEKNEPLKLAPGQLRLWVKTVPSARIMARGARKMGDAEFGLGPGDALSLALGDGSKTPRISLRLRLLGGDLRGELDADPSVRVAWGGAQGRAPPVQLPPVAPGNELFITAATQGGENQVQITLGLSAPK
jgi:serine/threonine-protein kinase